MLLSLLFALTAQADYTSDLKRIQDRGKQIDRMLMGFGATASSPQPQTNNPTNESAQNILVTHYSPNRLRAEPGRILSAQLVTRLVVSGENSPAVLEFNSNQGIFSGLRILGKAHQSSTEGRVAIDFDRVIFRGGNSQNVKASAFGDDKAYGIKAQVLSRQALLVGGALASGFISGYSASQQTQSTTAFGFTQTQPTVRNGILQGLAQSAADQSKRLIDEATKETPILIVEAGSTVLVYFDEEVRF